MEIKLTPEQVEKAKLAKSAEEIADDDLDSVAGGGIWGITIGGKPLVTLDSLCERWTCKKCHGTAYRRTAFEGCWCKTDGCGSQSNCGTCEYARYESSMLLCFHP